MSKRKRRKVIRRRHVKVRRTPRVEDEQGISATAETKRKRKYSTLGYLYRRDLLTWAQLAAAERIRKAVECITADVNYHPPSYEDQGRIPRRSGARPTGYSAPFETELQLNYSMWIAEMDRSKIPTGPVMDGALDEMPMKIIERKWRLPQGEALKRLKEGLDVYIKVNVRFRDVLVA